ncbi:MAG TPA: hypothetical protein VHB77_10200, partial [Planctomycetaceae bacterium]|nr:hypothetical protein [Planctomycetaceae bacterium]
MNRRAAVVTLVVLAISSVANAGIHMGDAAQLRRAYRALGSDDPTIRGRATVYLGNLDEVLALSARSYKRLTP